MGTSLCILTNSKLSGNETESDWEQIRQKLMALNWERTSVFRSGRYEQEEGDWSYYLNEDSVLKCVAEFEGPFSFTPDFYPSVGVIASIYRYQLLYQIADESWFTQFRKSIFELVQIMGGTEIIYVADNGCDKLYNFVNMAWENTPYEQIKEAMIKALGNPITDYNRLDRNALDYHHITEFVLDDFLDLK